MARDRSTGGGWGTGQVDLSLMCGFVKDLILIFQDDTVYVQYVCIADFFPSLMN